MEIPDLPGTSGVVADLENSEDLGSAGFGDGSNEYTEALLDLGEVHRRNVVGGVPLGYGGRDPADVI
jgi:hypothetical protein